MRSAIALVHIQIDHRHLQVRAPRPGTAAPLGLGQPGGHRHVIEYTKSAALVRISVVRATRQIGRHTVH